MSQSIAIDVSDQNTADLIYKKIDDMYLNKKKTKSKILSYLISTTLTLAEVGYVFYGAIIFGGIKFLKGAYNYITN
jgi:hypothetical protein